MNIFDLLSNFIDNPIYRFGHQQAGGVVDPSSQTEDIGDNAMKASDYGIENLKRIMKNLEQWTTKEGETYTGKVKSIMPYGAFVGIAPNVDGLLHVSEIDWKRIENVEDVLKEGQEIEVKLISIDPKSGKLKLSRKVLLPKPEKK